VDQEKEEQRIKELLANFKLKVPPEPLMKNYVEEVRRKIDRTPRGFDFGPKVFVCVLVLGLAVGGVLIFKPFIQKAPTKGTSLPTPTIATKEVIQANKQALFEKLSGDLFVLEMLGEDEGLLDDSTDRVETDMEFLATT